MTLKEEVILKQHDTERITKQLQFSVPASDNLHVYVCLNTCVSDMVQGEGKRYIGFISGFYWQNLTP